jgi:mono/diheme cytochrome c family protein
MRWNLSALTFCAALKLGLGVCLAQEKPAPVYTKDIAPILYEHCVLCHHSNDIAPMSLMNYKEVRPWAKAIREKVVQRIMPPWYGDPQAHEFSNDPRLRDEEIETIRQWVESGAKEGDPSDLPPAPTFQKGWHIEPDTVFTIPEHLVPAGQQDDYQVIFVPTNFAEDRWFQATEVLPGDRRVVHHINVNVLSAQEVAARQERSAKRAPKKVSFHFTTGTVSHMKMDAPVVDDGCSSPDGGALPGEPSGDWSVQPGIYLPGHLPEVQPPGYAIRIPKGSYLMFDIHYNNRLTEDVKDRTSIGLVTAKEPLTGEVGLLDIENEMFLIPPDASDHKVTACYTLDRAVLAIGMTAHMHFRGKSMKTEAFYPDGHSEVLLNVPKYDFRWQQTYILKKQSFLPKGTRLSVTAYFDNSVNNPLNPDHTRTIRWGEPSDEEMMAFWLQYAKPGN